MLCEIKTWNGPKKPPSMAAKKEAENKKTC
jgi:hypothetical protein